MARLDKHANGAYFVRNHSRAKAVKDVGALKCASFTMNALLLFLSFFPLDKSSAPVAMGAVTAAITGRFSFLLADDA